MADLARSLFAIFLGFSTGAVVAAAVFAFITVIGIVPHLAQKTNTKRFSRIYESAIAVGGILGTLAATFHMRIPGGAFIAVMLALCTGIFYGALAMSLAEVLDVMPILSRRGRVQRGMALFVIAIALGKLVGSLLYFLLGGFHDAGNM
jgi:stage V sporulation protein AB